MGLVSPDGRWWWDGKQWVPMHRDRPEPQSTASAMPHALIPILREVPRRFDRQIEPPEIRARFGSAMFLLELALTLPAAFVGTIFSMAVVTGQSPAWPTIGEGAVLYLIVLAFFGAWPTIGYALGFGLPDALRWILFGLACSGAAPALFLGGLMVIGDPGAMASDFVRMELALGWMWAVPAAALVLLRATRVGRPLPSPRAFLGMFGRRWRKGLPGPQTQWGEAAVGLGGSYRLRVPGAEFRMPFEARDAVLAAGGRARVTYDLSRGRIETIEVGPPDA